MKLVLDTGVLGQLCHPRKYDDVRAWFASTVDTYDFLLSEVADYELRRDLIRLGARRSLNRLDELGRELHYLPMSTPAWRSAAQLWAWVQRQPQNDLAAGGLDSHILIAAQARTATASVVTTHRHRFEPLVQAYEPHELLPQGQQQPHPPRSALSQQQLTKLLGALVELRWRVEASPLADSKALLDVLARAEGHLLSDDEQLQIGDRVELTKALQDHTQEAGEQIQALVARIVALLA